MLIRDAWIWRLLCTGGENLAAASESSVSRDGHLALQTISRDEFIKARILQQTNSPANVLSSKQLSSIRSFQWTHTQSEQPTKTFRRNPISGNQVYRKREMCNKTRQPPPQNIRRRYSRTPSTNLIHLPTKAFRRKPTPERPAVQKTRDTQQNASPTSTQHQTKTSAPPPSHPLFTLPPKTSDESK